jgi:hypothetical protein
VTWNLGHHCVTCLSRLNHNYSCKLPRWVIKNWIEVLTVDMLICSEHFSWLQPLLPRRCLGTTVDLLTNAKAPYHQKVLKSHTNWNINQGWWGLSMRLTQLRWHTLPCVMVTCYFIFENQQTTPDPGTIAKVTYHQKALNSHANPSREIKTSNEVQSSVLLSFHYHDRAILQFQDKLSIYYYISRPFMSFSSGITLIPVYMVL